MLDIYHKAQKGSLRAVCGVEKKNKEEYEKKD